jgi:inosine/xanthosine triphosphate pyrophosphatase family protein
MSDAEKHRISHRARAVVLARALLQRLAEESLQGEAQKRQQG